MSREIKFRVWDTVDAMHGPYTLYDLQSQRRVEFTTDCPVMQYTGLNDKNGKEVYEGDILDHMDAFGPCVVEYRTTEFVAVDSSGMGYDLCATCEVIGNIYENHELLKP
jgi:hypothetical protein